MTAAVLALMIGWPFASATARDPGSSARAAGAAGPSFDLAQAESTDAIGLPPAETTALPPAPTYIPGTVVSPAETPPTHKKSKAKRTASEKKQMKRKHGDGIAATKTPQQPVPAMSTVTSEPAPPPDAEPALSAAAVAAPLPVDAAQAGIWQKLVPLLPAPGHFAVIPDSALTPVLVRNGEFDFCQEIKCFRSSQVLAAWNGGAFDPVHGQFRVHGGGHADYGGNEVYAYDFGTLRWTRETEPQPLTGKFLIDQNGDGVPDACPAPASGPPAMHTYQGFVYVPKIDRYWLFGTVEYCANRMAGSSAWEYDAHSKTWTAMPQLNDFAKFARAVVDPRSGNVIVRGGTDDNWREIDVKTRQVIRTSKDNPFYLLSDGPAVFDGKAGRIYAIVKSQETDKLLAFDWPAQGGIIFQKGKSARVVASWPKGGKKGWGMAQDSFGRLVLWDGDARIVVVDPETGRSWETGTREESAKPTEHGIVFGRVYSKWAYIPELDTFFGITDPGRGIVLYRVGDLAGSVQAPRKAETARLVVAADASESATKPRSDPKRETKTAANSAPAPAATESRAAAVAPNDHGQTIPLEIKATSDWHTVCATAVLCDPMGEGKVLYRGKVVADGPPEMRKQWRRITNRMGHADSHPATADPKVGGLRFYFPSHSGSGSAGSYSTDFSPDYSFQVGPADMGAPAQEVYIQFQVRYSCTFIWADCDPASPNYRKVRRCFRERNTKNGCTASKIALISTGDREGFTADACTLIQTAINHVADHSLHAFHRCPRTREFGEKLPAVNGRAQRDMQPHGLYSCPKILNDGTHSGWNHTADTCFRLTDDRWITIQIRLRFGSWQKKPKDDEPKLSHVSIWASIEGEGDGRQKLVIDNDFYAMDPGNPKDLVGKIWLQPHLYGKDKKEDHPPFNVWYRNLVISQSLIPNLR